MALLTTYRGAGEVYYNGRLLVEITRARMSIRSNDNRVTTMQKQFAGFSDGPTEAEVTIDTAIPVAGYEVDYLDAVANKREVRVVFIDGSRRVTVAGRIQTKDAEMSDTNTASSTVTILGKLVGSL